MGTKVKTESSPRCRVRATTSPYLPKYLQISSKQATTTTVAGHWGSLARPTAVARKKFHGEIDDVTLQQSSERACQADAEATLLSCTVLLRLSVVVVL
jgi:hypothetical protein